MTWSRVQFWLRPLAKRGILSTVLVASLLLPMFAWGADEAARLAGTAPLSLQGDIAATMIAGVDRFLLGELNAAIGRRAALWQRDFSSPAAYEASVEPNRQRLAEKIGLRDPRRPNVAFELVGTPSRPALVGRGSGFEIYQVRWPVLIGVHGEGLLLVPTGKPPRANVVVLPDCEQSPEAAVGLVPGIAAESQIARRLAESGCRVIVPVLVNRGHELSSVAGGQRKSTATHREMLYRAAYQMGRHLIGYEVQKVLAAVDGFSRAATGGAQTPLGVIGYGEGGLVALYAAAVDRRIAVAGISGYFDARQNIWREPIDRNVFGLLREFGDAELATLVAPRAVVAEACAAPAILIPPGGDSAPAECGTPQIDSVRREVQRARELVKGLSPPPAIELIESGSAADGNSADKYGAGPSGTSAFLEHVLHHLGNCPLAAAGGPPQSLVGEFDITARHARTYQELAAFSQRLVSDGPQVRDRFLAKLDTSGDLERYRASAAPYRAHLRDEIIGHFDNKLLPPGARTRLAYDEPEFRGYEVVLDVFDDVMLYGILLVPKDLQPGERRPLVVCQHGLEGRAQFAVSGDQTSYRDFAARLARRGFVTFAPQHLYRGGDAFRTLARKANPLGKSLFSVMIAQHEQLLAWLGSLDLVDAQRIAFYGISYGGKSAMRIPAALDGYCLSICSSDFSDWIWRTVSDSHALGYLGHAEYEIFEFNLGSTFNYADLAALICPRPFMAEQFHRRGLMAKMDAGEYGRVRLLYENLGLAARTRFGYFEAFQPPVPYVERETFDFLHEQLRFPRK